MPALLILACSATKRLEQRPMPAIERYDGPAWRVLRRALRERPGLRAELRVWALSAKWGLISEQFPVWPYDRRLSADGARDLAPSVAVTARWLAGREPLAPVCINVGPLYRRALPDPLPWPVRWVEGPIGSRLAQLKEWLWTFPISPST